MKTITADPQLDDELQELYILSKHWISDIIFAEDEIRFLSNMFHKYLIPAPGDRQLPKANELKNDLAALDVSIPELKDKVTELLKFIDPLINKPEKEMKLDLLKHFFSVETEMKSLFESVKLVKRLLFAFVEEIMRREGHD